MMTHEKVKLLEATCMKCKSKHKCFAYAMEHPNSAIRCLSYGTFKEGFECWKRTLPDHFLDVTKKEQPGHEK
jgi:hypothetical protein